LVESKWIFQDYCPKTSKLGVLLQLEMRKIEEQGIEGVSEMEMQVRALTGLGETIGCEIKPYDFLAVGPEVYINKMRRNIGVGINKRIKELRKEKTERRENYDFCREPEIRRPVRT